MRDFTRLLGDARLGTETSLADQVRQGKVAGKSGLSSLFGELGQAKTGIEALNKENRFRGADLGRQLLGTTDPMTAGLISAALQGYNIFGGQEINLASIDKQHQGGINWPALIGSILGGASGFVPQ